MLDEIWENFLICLTTNEKLILCTNKLICGVNFLYVLPKQQMNEETVKTIITTCSKQFTKTFTLIYRIEFVRIDQEQLVFRHRFYVPNKKMFCCGNECVDCTRFRK